VITYSQVDSIAGDLEFAAILFKGEAVPLTAELVQMMSELHNSITVAAEILRALPIEVVEALPSHITK
jgi:hypothetical protein